MKSKHVYKATTYKIVQLDCGYAAIDTRDDLLSDGNRVNVLRVETVTQSRDAGSDFVELDAFLASIWWLSIAMLKKRKLSGCTYLASSRT